MTNFNTLALAYTNDKGEVLAWSADTFGSPRNYPKTYKDTQQTREMLSRKFTERERFANKTAELVSSANSFGGALMKASLEGDKKVFENKGVTKAVLVSLDLHTDYSKDLPKWNEVRECVDNKRYKLLE